MMSMRILIKSIAKIPKNCCPPINIKFYSHLHFGSGTHLITMPMLNSNRDILQKKVLVGPIRKKCPVSVNDRQISTSQPNCKEDISPSEMKKAMGQLTDLFTEARELIDDARESLDTVYFSEDMADAQKAVETTLTQYKTLLDKLSEDQRQEVLRTIGLKMEELKAQEDSIKDMLKDH